jgi:hypothetical protein
MNNHKYTRTSVTAIAATGLAFYVFRIHGWLAVWMFRRSDRSLWFILWLFAALLVSALLLQMKFDPRSRSFSSASSLIWGGATGYACSLWAYIITEVVIEKHLKAVLAEFCRDRMWYTLPVLVFLTCGWLAGILVSLLIRILIQRTQVNTKNI